MKKYKNRISCFVCFFSALAWLTQKPASLCDVTTLRRRPTGDQLTIWKIGEAKQCIFSGKVRRSLQQHLQHLLLIEWQEQIFGECVTIESHQDFNPKDGQSSWRSTHDGTTRALKKWEWNFILRNKTIAFNPVLKIAFINKMPQLFVIIQLWHKELDYSMHTLWQLPSLPWRKACRGSRPLCHVLLDLGRGCLDLWVKQPLPTKTDPTGTIYHALFCFCWSDLLTFPENLHSFALPIFQIVDWSPVGLLLKYRSRCRITMNQALSS